MREHYPRDKLGVEFCKEPQRTTCFQGPSGPDTTIAMSHRRHFLQALASTALVSPFTSSRLIAQTTAAKPITELPPLNRFPTMMQEWLTSEVAKAEAVGNARRAALKSKADALKYVETCKLFIRECFGPMPEKTPLNAKVTGIVERDGYKIEKVIFESRPGYLVTSNLYVPTGRKFPLPGVVGTCGHSDNGKGAEAYQSFAQGLARQGYVVLIFDPVGQGERVQWPVGFPKSKLKGTTTEHIQMGNQMSLVGEFIGSWFAWDGIRALDYLLTREEVDPKHVGVTGNSGGGTQTTWLAGLDDRWTMAAPACFVTTFLHNVENELPADTEQCPPRVLSFGLDHSDFIACMAPKPVIICTQEKDFFDARGGKEAFERLKQLYTLLGKPDNIQLQVGPDPHGYTQANREAMYRFFNSVTKISDAKAEPAITIEKDETLWCSPKGNVDELGSKLLSTFTQEKSLALKKQLSEMPHGDVATTLRGLLKMPKTKAPLTYRILRTAGARKYPSKGYCCYALKVDEQVELIVTRLYDESGFTSRPTRGPKHAVLYLSHRSADAELRDEPLVADLVKANPDAAIYAMDVRGIGDTQPNTCGSNQFDSLYGSHYFYAAHGVMLDKPLLGLRTFDVLRVIDWLATHEHETIHLAGLGWGALPAAFAALLSDRVKQVTLKHAIASYTALAEDPDYKCPFALLLPDSLARLDLPEVYAALQGKALNNLQPWGPRDAAK